MQIAIDNKYYQYHLLLHYWGGLAGIATLCTDIFELEFLSEVHCQHSLIKAALDKIESETKFSFMLDKYVKKYK
jgi:hypothetical protein